MTDMTQAESDEARRRIQQRAGLAPADAPGVQPIAQAFNVEQSARLEVLKLMIERGGWDNANEAVRQADILVQYVVYGTKPVAPEIALHG